MPSCLLWSETEHEDSSTAPPATGHRGRSQAGACRTRWCSNQTVRRRAGKLGSTKGALRSSNFFVASRVIECVSSSRFWPRGVVRAEAARSHGRPGQLQEAADAPEGLAMPSLKPCLDAMLHRSVASGINRVARPSLFWWAKGGRAQPLALRGRRGLGVGKLNVQQDG